MPPRSWHQALDLARGRTASAKEIERVAEQTSPEAARWAFVQWELRARATAKFERAEAMFFDRDGLEMATHERVSQYHASLFPPGELVADLTCGLGSDLIGLAMRGPAIGYELDPDRAELARLNLAAAGVDGEVHIGDGSDSADDYDYVFADPARRTGGSRVWRLSDYRPDPRTLIRNRHRLRVIKLSPMLPDAELSAFGGELRFLSFRGECREALVVSGGESGCEVASVHVETGSTLKPEAGPMAIGELGRFLFDPDPAAIRSHALTTLCGESGLRSVDGSPFLTGESAVESPWLRSYEIVEVEKWDLKRLAAALAALDARTPDIKTHGHAVRPEEWVKRLRRQGSRVVSIFAIGAGGSLAAVIAEPKDR
ncbi:MAG: hypothetical protein HONBIEJF_01814 [Fimbriimonadaceae bacterium]|nr:hypothetical protein [Fimbriimonadaceae bacterium]